MIIIGNIISFLSACFTVASSWSKIPKRMYLYQAAQCFVLAAADIFFGAYSGVTTLMLCGMRNVLAAYGRFSKWMLYFFIALILLIGLYSNNRGLIGLLPVFTTVMYTTGTYLLKRPIPIKVNIIMNLCLWSIYEFIVHDYVSVTMDTCSAMVAVISIWRLKNQAAAQSQSSPEYTEDGR